MTLCTANHSSYPRIGDRPEDQKLRRATDQLDKKEITEEDLEKVLREVIAEVISEEEQAGCDLVTDGQVRWHDPISHIMKGFKGVKIGRLLRFFDTNFYFRTPVVQGRLERKNGLIQAEVEHSLRSTRRPFKAVLTGPLTLASLSDLQGGEYKKVEPLAEDLTQLLAEEVAGLAKLGLRWIQIEEPIVLRKPDLFPLLARACKTFSSRKGNSKILLTTYFGDATPHYEKLLELSVDGLGLDCVYGPRLLEKVQRGNGGKVLALGLLDGRSTRLEKVDEVARQVRKAVEANVQTETHLTTSCGLEYLPRQRATEKLSLLSRLKGALS